MKGTFIRLLWFTIISCALAYGVFFVAGKMVFAQAAGKNDPIVIRDELGPGAHHLSGMITVAQTCDELHERVDQVSPTMYEVVFETWQEPSVPCRSEETPRAFRDVLFAPAVGVDFVATMDGAMLPITVIPVIEH